MVFDDEVDRVLYESPSLVLRLSRWTRKWNEQEIGDDDFIPFEENARRNMLGYYDDQINAILADPELHASLDRQMAQSRAGTLKTYTHEEARERMKSWGMDFTGPPRDWIFTKARSLLAADERLAGAVKTRIEATPWPLTVTPPSDDMRATLTLAAGLRRASRRHSPASWHSATESGR